MGITERILYKSERDPALAPAAWRVTDPRQLSGEAAGAARLDPRRLGEAPALTEKQRAALAAGRLTAVNALHPRHEAALDFVTPRPGKKRVHLLAVGDVGSALLLALKLLGGDVISTAGICDLSERTVARWVTEMGQIAWPWDYEALPEVEAVGPEGLFGCDVFLFAAAKAIPPVGSAVEDVRMAQLEANRPLAESFARQAREAGFRGLFIVLSDPVDPLCRAVWRASNTGPGGELDYLGLLPEQIQGFGLGVMNARAAYFARRDPRFASFLTQGRTFGPHGKGLVAANSVERYDDALSRELTRLTLEANLRVRDLGFKPYVAPAVSSGAMQLLLALRGEWHCSSVPLGGVWFGCKNRFTPYGLELETLELPDALFDRLRETERALHEIS
ncbi:lactate dehydrogenase [uncultured Oscillibacter sp.]|uniref:lactate dehydrogenase n=1 Tax=uncultured Oscillibacter sp. TaxID=876091 RepID=UPI002634AA1B|nr:lactate dehydrogenase [uncultured Oscillibacter sp.]